MRLVLSQVHYESKWEKLGLNTIDYHWCVIVRVTEKTILYYADLSIVLSLPKKS